MTDVSPSVAAPPPLCAVHAGIEATFTCSRCGCFACAACAGSPLTATGAGSPAAATDEVCAACMARPTHRLGVSRRAKACVALALLALHGLFPLGLVVLWLASREREAIAAHASPRGGEPWIQGARWLAWASLLAWTVFWSSLVLQ